MTAINRVTDETVKNEACRIFSGKILQIELFIIKPGVGVIRCNFRVLNSAAVMQGQCEI